MDKRELLSRVGSIQQVASVRPVSFEEGRSRGMAGYLVTNGDMSFTVMADKCLDIAELRFKGTNFSFLSKPGLMGRNHFDTNGEEALRSIMGGLFFTCGLENICAPCNIDGKDYPMHGRLRTTPAEHLRADASWENDEYVLEVAGEMREAELFGENLILRRSIKTVLGTKAIEIVDEIENQAFRDEPLMLMYHFNIGHPLLSEQSEVLLPSIKVRPRDETSAPHVARWKEVDSPTPNAPEYVFIHELAGDHESKTFAAIFNHKTKLGIQLDFNKNFLSHFMQWKSMASGDYVMGLEPSNSSVYGKRYHVDNNCVQKLAPLEKVTANLRITVLEGDEDFDALRERAEKLIAVHN